MCGSIGAMMELNDRKERFSLAYISAVAAHAGYKFLEATPPDKDSIDGFLIGQEGRRPMIAFQAKATGRDVLTDTDLIFVLSIKNYDDLRADTLVPRLLIVVLLPEAEADWLEHSEDELKLRRCGYWLSLSGLPETDNATSVTVHLPRTQVLTSEHLAVLMSRAGLGEPL
jgi:hypothetical protein